MKPFNLTWLLCVKTFVGVKRNSWCDSRKILIFHLTASPVKPLMIGILSVIIELCLDASLSNIDISLDSLCCEATHDMNSWCNSRTMFGCFIEQSVVNATRGRNFSFIPQTKSRTPPAVFPLPCRAYV